VSEALAPGAVLLRGFALPGAIELISGIEKVIAAAPLRHMVTPGGFRMSVATANCGALGWLSDRKGYRYGACDPESGKPWPSIPDAFLRLAREAAGAAGFAAFVPDACLVNRYAPGARLTLHQDRNERDFRQPIVSVSLGIPAVFLFGGFKRRDKPARIPLEHGDVAVWGGPSRLRFHGVMPLKEAQHPLLGACRFNLTFRNAG
jgi:alkylated DNA repair protein (DNA oxidative demethylase)